MGSRRDYDLKVAESPQEEKDEEEEEGEKF